MSEANQGGVKWGSIIAGAAMVTAVVAAFLFIPGAGQSVGVAMGKVGEIMKNVTDWIGQSIGSIGTTMGDIGGWITKNVQDLRDFGVPGGKIDFAHSSAVLGAAAVTGGLGMAAFTSFVDRVNNSAEMVGVETGRGK